MFTYGDIKHKREAKSNNNRTDEGSVKHNKDNLIGDDEMTGKRGFNALYKDDLQKYRNAERLKAKQQAEQEKCIQQNKNDSGQSQEVEEKDEVCLKQDDSGEVPSQQAPLNEKEESVQQTKNDSGQSQEVEESENDEVIIDHAPVAEDVQAAPTVQVVAPTRTWGGYFTSFFPRGAPLAQRETQSAQEEEKDGFVNVKGNEGQQTNPNGTISNNDGTDFDVEIVAGLGSNILGSDVHAI